MIRVLIFKRYIEALLLLWVCYQDSKKEMFWFSNLYDICGIFQDPYGFHILSRIERHCRHVTQALPDHIDELEDSDYNTSTLSRVISLHAGRICGIERPVRYIMIRTTSNITRGA